MKLTYKEIAELTIDMLKTEDKSFDYCLQFCSDITQCDIEKLRDKIFQLLRAGE